MPHLREDDIRRFVVRGTGNQLADNKSLKDMLDDLDALVDNLETRISAARAGYLDNLNNALLLKLPIQLIAFLSGSIAAGATRYPYWTSGYADYGDDANETLAGCNFIITRAGTLKRLAVKSYDSPGVGQTYTYTVRVNGADSALTCTISGGTARAANDGTHSVTVVLGDRVSLKVVTSSGAATGGHIAMLDFEGA